MNANQCNLNCPVNVLKGLEYRLSTEHAGALGKLAAGVGAGIEGVVQAGYAALRCPSREQTAAEWEPSERCMGMVTTRLEQLDVDRSRMTPHEIAVLLPIMRVLGDGEGQAW